ncbi:MULTISPECIES: ABC transporter ATP-binding protein [Hyphomicrobiales]|jgi:ABC-type branched-subunit amino acid transport system ATPase component|uniref:Branched-chain amino acid ABC transporter ATP-binding protein n=2 Tax=Prosthecodimorpha TaxID=2981530 RepID=A0A0P6VQ69_9HYPH|nr:MULTISPECIES: ABC transporter ATP-binding protein [Hyphomicrobiales]KPL53341.1 branched-chain amino acid ABC transporter ATP-binding protein [Prosthecomicrobium hirschii]MBT9291004.1 ABC transporter ATP-binding protein [Prosthecodimorpha staleyi]MCW1842395.1 ABC transporter ATP-binding protein [Prosthecomicrobium hirschii]
MLSVDRIDAFYGDSQILHGVSLTVGEKERVAVVGRNGAGKSTLFKSILNAGPRVRGRIAWEGKDLGAMPTFRRARLGLSLVPEDRRIFDHVTVLENIAMARYAARPGVELEAPEAVLARFPMLVPLKDRMGGRLSGGQQQMVAVARAIAGRPRLMLLDEPTEGLAPVIVEQLARDVNTVCRETGSGLLLSEQNLWFARQCTDRLFLIDTGRIVFDGLWQDLDDNPDLKRRYLAL